MNHKRDGHCYSVVLANPVYMVALGGPGGLQGAGRKGSALSPFAPRRVQLGRRPRHRHLYMKEAASRVHVVLL